MKRAALSTKTDEELLVLYTRGELLAMETLLDRYERPLFAFVVRQIGDRARAEDLVQETFLRLIEHGGTFEGQSRLKTWIYRIARNLCIDEGRRRVHRKHASLDSGSGRDGEDAGLYERVAARAPTTDRTVVSQQMALAMARAIAALPDDQRETFLLRQAHDLAFKEIAEIVGVPENTVKSRMRYALTRLQEALAEYRDYAEELA